MFDLAASAIIEKPPTTDDASVRGLLRHPAQMGGSDAIYVAGHPHQRDWGWQRPEWTMSSSTAYPCSATVNSPGGVPAGP